MPSFKISESLISSLILWFFSFR